MNCPKCQKPLLVEDLGGGHKKVHCASCGLTEVRDEKDRKLLTGELEGPTRSTVSGRSQGGRSYLTEG